MHARRAVTRGLIAAAAVLAVAAPSAVASPASSPSVIGTSASRSGGTSAPSATRVPCTNTELMAKGPVFADVCTAAQQSSAEALIALCEQSTQCSTMPPAMKKRMYRSWASPAYRAKIVKAMNTSYMGADLQVAPASGWTASYCSAKYPEEIPWRVQGSEWDQLVTDSRALGLKAPVLQAHPTTCERFLKTPAVYWAWSTEESDYEFMGTATWGTPYKEFWG